MEQRKVLVVGSGLIGTSIALALTSRNHSVLISDTDTNAAQTAIAKSGAQLWDGSSLVDLVIVATPPAVTAQVIRQMVLAQPTAVITDVSSVKGAIFSDLEDLDSDALSRIVGGHPMAGREVSGAASALSNLFVDRSWVITRNKFTSDASFTVVENLALELGAVPIERSIEDHDRAVALISHTPQVVASVLASQLINAPDSDVALAGQGLRDTIRIASSNADLWSQILAGNATQVARQVTSVAHDLAEFARALLDGDEPEIENVLAKGSQGRDRLPGKHGSQRTALATLSVRLEDQPGELARLFAVAAGAGVNLEDVRIDHSLGRMTGLVELTVEPHNIPVLEQALSSADFTVVT